MMSNKGHRLVAAGFLGLAGLVSSLCRVEATERRPTVRYVQRTLYAENDKGDKISFTDSGGTGTVIDSFYKPDGLYTVVVTARHVVDNEPPAPPDGYTVYAETFALTLDNQEPDSDDAYAVVVGVDRDDHAVLLTRERIDYRARPFCTVSEGDAVSARGYPYGFGPATLYGHNLGAVGVIEGLDRYVLDLHAAPGVSGALVIREDGDCIAGMVVSINTGLGMYALATTHEGLEALVEGVKGDAKTVGEALAVECPVLAGLQVLPSSPLPEPGDDFGAANP